MTTELDPPPKNQQFAHLNAFRRERALLDVYLVSGVRLRGRIKSFDQYSLMLDTGQGDAFLYHHAISSLGPAQIRGAPRRPAPVAQQVATEEPERAERPRTPAARAPEVTVVRRVSRKITVPRDGDA